MGGALLASFWRRDYRWNDADHQRNRASLLDRWIPLYLVEPKPGHRLRNLKPRVWSLRLLPNRLCRGTIHLTPQLEAELSARLAISHTIRLTRIPELGINTAF